MQRSSKLALFLLLAAGGIARSAPPVVVVEPKPAPGALDNPLKGWCPYPRTDIRRPHSMTFHYVSWKELEPVEGRYEFERWERERWDAPGAAGKHVVFRVWVDYPSKESGLPDWLRGRGVREEKYSAHGGGLSPDYDDPELLEAMRRLIVALGERYNDDPRVAFVQIGLLGFWGEWHCHPRNELYASPRTEEVVLAAYRRAFPDKQLMVRYARETSGRHDWIGFHDDYFPQDTDGEDWMFLPQIRKHGRSDNWRRAPIGGEMIPGEAKKWLGEGYDTTRAMVERSRFTWMGPYCPAQEDPASVSEDFTRRCDALVRQMGYDFRIKKFGHEPTIRSGRPAKFALLAENLGVAPFYYRWPFEVALLDERGEAVATAATPWDIRRWQPGEPINERATLRFGGVTAGEYRLAIGIRDPWKGVPAIAFANELRRAGGWSILSRVTVEE